MANLITQPAGDVYTAPPNLDLLPAGAFERNDPLELTNQLGRATDRLTATQGFSPGLVPGDPGFGLAPQPPEPRVPAHALDDKYGIDGPTPELSLHFTAPLPESVAQEMHQAKQGEIARSNAAARTPASVGTVLGDLGVGFLDPVGLAAGVLPGVGEARVAQLLGRAGINLGEGILGRTAARAAAGAISGAGAMVPLEGLHMALSGQEQQDVSMWDAARQVAFGGLLGGVLHPVTGAIGDMLRGVLPGATNPGDADRAAVHASTAGVLDDTPVNVAPMLDAAPLGSAYAARLAARGVTEAGTYRAYAPNHMTVDLRPEVVEADSLVTSHNDDGTINPAYPAELQPRDRTSASSQEQVTEMASRLEPERLGPSPEVATGAPIVGPDGVVESGNGRVMALRRVHGTPALADQATAYRAYLEAMGFDTSEMQAPVLIGRRMSDLTPEDRVTFSRSGNETPVLDMNTAEQARSDAARAGAAVDKWQPGAITSEANEGFVGAFMKQLPLEERGGMRLPNGRLSAEGERRVRAALLAHAYGDQLGPTLERLLNGDTGHMRGVAGALTDAAGRWGQMRAAAARGEIPAQLDITPALGEAVQLLDDARRTGRALPDVLAQGNAFNPPSAAATGLLRMMFADDAMRRPIARGRMAELLTAYADEALKAQPGPGLFGAPETGPGDVLRTVAGSGMAAQAAVEALAEHADRVRAAEAAGGDDAPTIAQARAAAPAPADEGLPGLEKTTETPGAPKVAAPVAVPGADDPHIGQLAPEQQTVLHQLYAQAARRKTQFDATLADIARQVGGRMEPVPLKGMGSKGTARTVEKIVNDYGGDASRIKDLLRATIEVDTPDQARAALALVDGRMNVRPEGRRDMIGGEPGADGYRDIKVNTAEGGGLVAEVQINLRGMLEAKKQAHGLYEEREVLARSIGDRMRTPDERAEIDRLNAQMRAIYEPAWERALRDEETSSRNAASEMGAPLRLAEDGSNGRGGSVSQAEEYRGEPATSPSETGMPSTSKNSLAISSSPQADVGVAIPENKSETRMPAESGAQLEPDIEAARRDGLITAEEAAELGKADTDSAAQQSALQAAAMCVARGVL